MSDRRNKLAALLAHWPQLSERERAGLVAALGLNGVLTMTLEVVSIVVLVRVVRQSWLAGDRDPAAAGRAAAARRVGHWVLLSVGQQAAARLAFTSYGRYLSRRSLTRGARAD